MPRKQPDTELPIKTAQLLRTLPKAESLMLICGTDSPSETVHLIKAPYNVFIRGGLVQFEKAQCTVHAGRRGRNCSVSSSFIDVTKFVVAARQLRKRSSESVFDAGPAKRFKPSEHNDSIISYLPLG
jgi:hypothetical protein